MKIILVGMFRIMQYISGQKNTSQRLARLVIILPMPENGIGKNFAS
jgi:hypothetical protein